MMTQYAVLLEVEVLHDYYLNRGEIVHEAVNADLQARVMEQYSVARFLTITPTAQTQHLLAGHQMIFKPTATGFLVAVKCDPAAPVPRPAIPLGPDFCLSLALQINDARFFNYTALTATSFYYFSNTSTLAMDQGAADQASFLSVPVPLFDASRRYEADQVYSESSGGEVNLFRALRDTGPAATPISADWRRIPADTFDPTVSYARGSVVLATNRLYRARVDAPGSDLDNTAHWERLMTLPNQYVTSADYRSVKSTRFHLDLRGAAQPEVTVQILRRDETTPVWRRHYRAETGNLDTVQLDLRHLLPGAYRLAVMDSALTDLPDLGFEFYLDATAVRDRWFGVIELKLGSGNFALLDGSGNLRGPRYKLRFLNRATRWRYLFPADQAVGVGADVSAEVDGNNRILITALPRPLTRYGTGIRLQADTAETPTLSEEVRLPEPEINRIRRQNAQWYSEIHLSNLPL